MTTAEARDVDVVILMTMATAVAGHVTGAGGQPLADFTVTMIPTDRPEAPPVVARIADPAGGFRVAP